MDSETANILALAVGAPAWIGVLIYLLRTFKVWPEIQARFNERFRDRAQISSGDWHNLREQIQWLTEEVKECRKSEGEWMTRAIKAEAMVDGYGEIRQSAAIAQAEVRMEAEQRKKGEEEGE